MYAAELHRNGSIDSYNILCEVGRRIGHLFFIHLFYSLEIICMENNVCWDSHYSIKHFRIVCKCRAIRTLKPCQSSPTTMDCSTKSIHRNSNTSQKTVDIRANKINQKKENRMHRKLFGLYKVMKKISSKSPHRLFVCFGSLHSPKQKQ